MPLTRTTSANPDFLTLVKLLDADLATRDGSEHDFYAQYNGVSAIRHVIVFYNENEPVSCGAIKEFEPGIMEIKRMYTLPEWRGKGLASIILRGLETWALELGYSKCILETGKRQPEAIALYQRNNYHPIENYGQYAGIDNSVCFEKKLL